MKVLVIDGSPHGQNGNTFKITKSFLKGLDEDNVEIINTHQLNIKDCLGCFTCWTRTPGICITKNDDMPPNLKKYREADLIIFSFPLYVFSIPSTVKKFLERLLPNAIPFINIREDGSHYHPHRFDDFANKKFMVISTCGLGTKKTNYESLTKLFEIFCRTSYEKILCPEPGLLDVPEIGSAYLNNVEEAGKEFKENLELSKETRDKFEVEFASDTYVEWVNNHFIHTLKENGLENTPEYQKYVKITKTDLELKQYIEKVLGELKN